MFLSTATFLVGITATLASTAKEDRLFMTLLFIVLVPDFGALAEIPLLLITAGTDSTFVSACKGVGSLFGTIMAVIFLELAAFVFIIVLATVFAALTADCVGTVDTTRWLFILLNCDCTTAFFASVIILFTVLVAHIISSGVLASSCPD
ncbi:putative orfan [Tupanvirus soda lake]|uniref:Orfan n=2 Tax=Tupanvirus TaxID=2094720 RepID=A0AC62AAU8_9VIRU|nr:putative orfan [Tupanvirus soda lake]QKU34907.1 putative orfan [Tupanvirus soda lake]